MEGKTLLAGLTDPTSVFQEIAETKGSEDMQKAVKEAVLVSRIMENFNEAETARYDVENQWTKNTRAYRGEDSNTKLENGGPSVFRESEVHKPYIRTTTVKTRAAYAQIMESLMQNSRFPLMIEPTPVAEDLPDYVTNDPAADMMKDTQEDFGIGFEGDGQQLAPGATADNPEAMWKQEYPNMKEGHATSPDFAQISPAQRAAEKMNKVILDQLEESNAHTELRKSVFEACLLGTGIMKGVMSEFKTVHKWVKGQYQPETRKYPKINHVSVWDLYVDPNASQIEDAEWVIERHRMHRKQLRDLKTKASAGFRPDAIQKAIEAGANYTRQRFETEMREDETIVNNGRLWEVYEYWGYMDKEEAEAVGLDIGGVEVAQVNVWVCGNQILRAVVNPFTPQRIPYFMFSYETDAYNLYGTGVPEAMEDCQKMMNGFARLAVDNLALAGNMIFDVDESMLTPGQNLEIYPGKVIKRQGGQPGSAVTAIKFPSTANENLQMFQEWRRQADEATGIPSVAHGQTGVSGVGRTSSGLNMILENASLSIKTTIRNIDDDLLQPLGKMLFYWNMQYNSENIPEGDFTCIATGIRSYTKQEVKVQRLQTLLQLTQNPALAPMVKLPYIIRELVKGMDLDPNEIINDMDEARMYAEIMGMAGGAQQGAPVEGPSTQGTSGLQGTGAGNPEGLNGSEITGG